MAEKRKMTETELRVLKKRYGRTQTPIEEASKRWGFDWKKVDIVTKAKEYRYLEQVICTRCIQKVNAGLKLFHQQKVNSSTQTDELEDLSNLLPPDFEDMLAELDELAETE